MFSWSKNNGSSHAYPGMRHGAQTASVVEGSIRPPSMTRQQHLDSFLNDESLKRSTKKVSADDTTYDTVFMTVNSDTLILRVYFPKSGSIVPSMSLTGVHATHAWLNNRMQVVGYPPLQNQHAWQQSQLSLGEAVHNVAQEFQLHPPEIVSFVDDELRKIQTTQNGRKNGGSNTVGSSITSSHSRRNSSSDEAAAAAAASPPPDYSSFYQQKSPLVKLPPLPRKFDQLSNLDIDTLQSMLDDELELKAWVHRNVDYMDNIRIASREQLEENEKVARQNLSKKEELDTLGEEVMTLQVKLEAKVKQFKKLEKEQDELCAPPDKQAIVKELQYLKKEAFRESESFAENWLDEGGSVDDFLKEFLPSRQNHHTRAGQMELLDR